MEFDDIMSALHYADKLSREDLLRVCAGLTRALIECKIDLTTCACNIAESSTCTNFKEIAFNVKGIMNLIYEDPVCQDLGHADPLKVFAAVRQAKNYTREARTMLEDLLTGYNKTVIRRAAEPPARAAVDEPTADEPELYDDDDDNDDEPDAGAGAGADVDLYVADEIERQQQAAANPRQAQRKRLLNVRAKVEHWTMPLDEAWDETQLAQQIANMRAMANAGRQEADDAADMDKHMARNMVRQLLNLRAEVAEAEAHPRVGRLPDEADADKEEDNPKPATSFSFKKLFGGQ